MKCKGALALRKSYNAKITRQGFFFLSHKHDPKGIISQHTGDDRRRGKTSDTDDVSVPDPIPVAVAVAVTVTVTVSRTMSLKLTLP